MVNNIHPLIVGDGMREKQKNWGKRRSVRWLADILSYRYVEGAADSWSTLKKRHITGIWIYWSNLYKRHLGWRYWYIFTSLAWQEATGMGEVAQRKSVKWKDGQGKNTRTHWYLKGEVRKRNTQMQPRRNDQRSRQRTRRQWP